MRWRKLRNQRLASVPRLEFSEYKEGDFSPFVVDYWGYLSGNTHAVHPETRRSRAPCDRDTVTVHCAGRTLGHIVGETTVVTPSDAAPERPVTEPLSQHCAAQTTVVYPGTHRSPD